jgi:hypothetical protein
MDILRACGDDVPTVPGLGDHIPSKRYHRRDCTLLEMRLLLLRLTVLKGIYTVLHFVLVGVVVALTYCNVGIGKAK